MIAPLAPGATIGIVGTGQLGRMLALAAAKLGFRVRTFGPEEDPPAARVADSHTSARYEDVDTLTAFAKTIDVATYEFENIPPLTVRALMDAGVPVRPDDQVLSVCQDRLAEKTFLQDMGLATAAFFSVDKLSDIAPALAQTSGKAILKTRRFGYDGKGQARIDPGTDPAIAFEACGGQPCILEGLVSFDCEISQIAARGADGAKAFFDPACNSHRDGILRLSEVPSGVPHATIDQARVLTGALLDKLNYVGVMTVEFFWSTKQGLIANEIAPRVHNSGHWTVEACAVSQFEQHIRAVAGWPLGDGARHSDAEMHNLIGQDAEAWESLLTDPAVSLTLYGKREMRRGRKMGHWVRTAPIRRWRTGRGIHDTPDTPAS